VYIIDAARGIEIIVLDQMLKPIIGKWRGHAAQTEFAAIARFIGSVVPEVAASPARVDTLPRCAFLA
jgi:hypothetical protein